MKKIFFILLGVTIITLTATFVDLRRSDRSGCAFCEPQVLAKQTFFEGDGVLGILTYKPAVPGHVLIIPKRHVERFEELTSEEIKAIGEVIQKVDLAVRKTFGVHDYVLIQKNGKEAGQSVPHVHFHYVPASPFLAAKFLITPWLKPLNDEELKYLRETLSESF